MSTCTFHQRRYDTRASIRLIASAIALSVGVTTPRLSAHAQRVVPPLTFHTRTQIQTEITS